MRDLEVKSQPRPFTEQYQCCQNGGRLPSAAASARRISLVIWHGSEMTATAADGMQLLNVSDRRGRGVARQRHTRHIRHPSLAECRDTA